MQSAAAAQACLESLRRSQWQVTAGLTPDQHTLTHGCSDVAAAQAAATAAAVAAVTAADTAALEVGPAAAAVVAVAAAAASLAVAAGPAVDPAAVAVAVAFGPSLQAVTAFAADMTHTGAVAFPGSGLVEGQAMQLALAAAVVGAGRRS